MRLFPQGQKHFQVHQVKPAVSMEQSEPVVKMEENEDYFDDSLDTSYDGNYFFPFKTLSIKN